MQQRHMKGTKCMSPQYKLKNCLNSLGITSWASRVSSGFHDSWAASSSIRQLLANGWIPVCFLHYCEDKKKKSKSQSNEVVLLQGLPGLRGEKGDVGERGEKVDVDMVLTLQRTDVNGQWWEIQWSTMCLTTGHCSWQKLRRLLFNDTNTLLTAS